MELHLHRENEAERLRAAAEAAEAARREAELRQLREAEEAAREARWRRVSVRGSLDSVRGSLGTAYRSMRRSVITRVSVTHRAPPAPPMDSA